MCSDTTRLSPFSRDSPRSRPQSGTLRISLATRHSRISLGCSPTSNLINPLTLPHTNSRTHFRARTPLAVRRLGTPNLWQSAQSILFEYEDTCPDLADTLSNAQSWIRGKLLRHRFSTTRPSRRRLLSPALSLSSFIALPPSPPPSRRYRCPSTPSSAARPDGPTVF